MSWLPPGRERSGTSIPLVHGRCCAVTPMPGFQRPNVAAAETSRRGSRAAGGGWCRCGGITARSVWTAGCCRFRWRGVARRCGSAWTATCPTPPAQVRSVTLLYDAGRLWLDVTAEVPVAAYPAGQEPDPGRVAGVDLGIIHPYAVAGPDAQGLLVSGRAIRAEHHLHHADAKARSRAAARRAPKPGQAGSRRWRRHRRRERRAEARHRRRVGQAQHEAAAMVIDWAVQRRVGTLAVGDPRGVLNLAAGRRHNRRVRDWRVGHLIRVLADKAEQAGITLTLVDERGSSSTCPKCYRRVPKPSGRVFTCPHCPFRGPRDLVAGVHIAARAGGGITPVIVPADVTHRRAGAHLPGVSPSRRDPRRRPHHGRARGSPGRHRPAPPAPGRGVARLTARTP